MRGIVASMAEGRPPSYSAFRLEQATVMVSTQAACDSASARTMLAARAEELGQTVEETALDVLDGIVRFDLSTPT